MTQINILIETNASGYSAFFPDLEGYQVQGESLDSVIDAVKAKLRAYLSAQATDTNSRNNRPIWELAQEITSAASGSALKGRMVRAWESVKFSRSHPLIIPRRFSILSQIGLPSVTFRN